VEWRRRRVAGRIKTAVVPSAGCDTHYTRDEFVADARGIAKTVTKVNLYDGSTDYAFWQSQPYLARLAALEQIRQEYHRWKYGAEPRLQRVYSVTSR